MLTFEFPAPLTFQRGVASFLSPVSMMSQGGARQMTVCRLRLTDAGKRFLLIAGRATLSIVETLLRPRGFAATSSALPNNCFSRLLAVGASLGVLATPPLTCVGVPFRRSWGFCGFAPDFGVATERREVGFTADATERREVDWRQISADAGYRL